MGSPNLGPRPPLPDRSASPSLATNLDPTRWRTPISQLIGRLRYITLLAVLGLSITSFASFGWAGAKTAKLVGELLEGGWRDDVNLGLLLGIIDIYLLAVVQMIMAIGLYELFIGDLEVPDWLEIHSLDDLKKALVDVLVVFMAVTGVKGLLSAEDAGDALRQAAAVALVIIALTFFRIATSRAKAGPPYQRE